MQNPNIGQLNVYDPKIMDNDRVINKTEENLVVKDINNNQLFLTNTKRKELHPIAFEQKVSDNLNKQVIVHNQIYNRNKTETKIEYNRPSIKNEEEEKSCLCKCLNYIQFCLFLPVFILCLLFANPCNLNKTCKRIEKYYSYCCCGQKMPKSEPVNDSF